MTKLNLFFVFFICINCFLTGWMAAVYILPGYGLESTTSTTKVKTDLFLNSQNIRDTESTTTHLHGSKNRKNPEKKRELSLLVEEMRNNIMTLFDPYKLDSLWTNQNHFKKNSSKLKTNTGLSPPLQATNQQKPKYQILKLKSSPGKPKKIQPIPSNPSETSKKDSQTTLLNPEEAPPPTEKTKALQKLRDKYDKQNREQLLKIVKEQDYFSLEGKFGYLINAFSEHEAASSYVAKMKEQHPLWSFLIKIHEDHIRIYLGPFQTREKAVKFKK